MLQTTIYCYLLSFMIYFMHNKQDLSLASQTRFSCWLNLTREESFMATNLPKGSGRKGAVKGRSQSYNPKTGLYTKRDTSTGKFMDVKTTGGKFKGVRKEK